MKSDSKPLEEKDQTQLYQTDGTVMKKKCFWLLMPFFYGVECHFPQYFSYIVAVSFIGDGNQRTRRKPLIYRKSLTNIIT